MDVDGCDGAIWSHLEPIGAVLSYFSYLELFGATWRYLELTKAI